MSRITCCQLAPVVGELEQNSELAAAAIAGAVAAGSELVVLPELVTSGYCFASAAEARASAISRDSAVFDGWSAAAGPAVVVAGFAELGADGELYNSAVLLSGDTRTVYRKLHLWDREKLFFRVGCELPPVVETPLGRIGFCVCYDLEFPELTRSIALRGADLLAVPTNWPWVERPAGMPAPEVMIAMAAARVNRMPIAICDRQGVERGQRWNCESSVIGVDGWVLATAGDSDTVTVELELTAGRDKRTSERNDVHADRRTDVYD